jgi:hypothetical protein
MKELVHLEDAEDRIAVEIPQILAVAAGLDPKGRHPRRRALRIDE